MAREKVLGSLRSASPVLRWFGFLVLSFFMSPPSRRRFSRMSADQGKPKAQPQGRKTRFSFACAGRRSWMTKDTKKHKGDQEIRISARQFPRQFQIGTGLHPGVGRFCGVEAADPTELTGRPWDFPSVRKWDTLSLRITVGFVQVIARREDYIGQNKCRPTQYL